MTITREQLEQAARLRGEGATWNAIREATGTKLGSSQFFRHWEQEKIPHRPAREQKVEAAHDAADAERQTAQKPKATTANAAPSPNVTDRNKTKPATTRRRPRKTKATAGPKETK